jgi:hypothetical protein
MRAGITPRGGFEDSLSAVAHGLRCQPLEVGLASEARSTTKESAKAPCTMTTFLTDSARAGATAADSSATAAVAATTGLFSIEFCFIVNLIQPEG